MKVLCWLFVGLLFFSSCKKEEKRYLVVSKIKSAAKLATTETIVDKVVFGSQERRFLGFVRLNEARFVAASQAIVKAGIDLEKLRADDIKIEDKRIEINLPSVEVLNFSYPFTLFEIDNAITDNAFLNKIDIEDHEYFYQQAELDIRRNLQHLGIRQTTEQKTRLMMTGLLKNLGYEEIYLTFRQGKLIPEVPTDDTLHYE